MAGFDRSKFSGTKVADLKKQDEDYEKKNDYKNNGRAGFIKLAEGKNKVRIFPAHPDTPSFYQPCTVHWLPRLNEWEDKDGNKKSETKRGPVFSAKAHSTLGKCPIDSYIHHVYKLAAEEYQDKAEKENFVAPIKGQEGITGTTKWIVFAEIKGEFGRLELPTSVKNAMNDIAIGQDDGDGVIETDPFTDPDSGRCVYITKDSQLSVEKAKREASKYYSTAIDLKGSTPLSDEQLGKLEEQQSLEEMYVDVYTRKDFDLAIKGLEMFDKDKGFGIFQIDEFLDTIEDIYNALPEIVEEGEEESKSSKKDNVEPKKSPSRKSSSRKKPDPIEEEETKEEESGDEGKDDLPFDIPFNEMDMDQLEGVIRRNSLPIRITKRTGLEDLQEWVQEEMDILEKEQSSAKKEDSKESGSRRRGSGDRLSKLSKELSD